MSRRLRLLTIGHSYVVELNRVLAYELGQVGAGRWDVTAVAPDFLGGFLRPARFEEGNPRGCRVEAVATRLSRWPHVMWYGKRLGELLREGWDMIHCWEEPFILAGAQVMAGAPTGAPVVIRTYQNIVKRYPPPFSWFNSYCFQRCAGWEAAGTEVLRTMLALGLGGKPHAVIPEGVDLEAFRPDPGVRREIRRVLGLDDPGPPVVGFAGRFVPEKGLPDLLGALERTVPAWQALFIGEGALERELRAWASTQGRKAVVKTGVPHSQVHQYFAAIDILAVPSRTTSRWREQFGRVLIEAFAAGVPVIGSDSGEIPHVLHGAGVVVAERDAWSWAQELSVLLESPARRRELAQAGRERARTRYAWPIVARQHLDFFESLLDQAT